MSYYASIAGQALFWLSWPILWFYLHGTHRTRILVVHKGHFLVTKQWLSDGRWALPGGGRHRGESALDAACRELREETGINVQPEQLTHLGTELFSSHGFSFNYDLFYIVLHEPPVINRQAMEISHVAWMLPDEVAPETSGSDVMTGIRHWPR